MSALYDLTVWRGATGFYSANGCRLESVTYKANGVAVDLTGSEIVLAIDAPNGQEHMRKSSATGGITLGPGAGVISLPLTAAESLTFAIGTTYRYEIQRRIGGTRVTFMHGAVRVVGGVHGDSG